MKSKRLFWIWLLVASLSFGVLQCESPNDPGERVGAICNDGTHSTATGSGACSHHGGVKEWIYK